MNHLNMDSTTFKKLQSKWYRLASRSGFNDIEDDEGNLVAGRVRFDIKAGHSFEDTRDYYLMASEILDHWPETWNMDMKKVWRFHAKGYDTARIIKITGKEWRTIMRIIIKVQNTFGLVRRDKTK